ncbi:hypothetical protein LIER_39049 [Lithospermum erythrorhizon]|uniref:DUF7036 domain-containing protein n=1 Tax=Lithospermum erythrorhizon TaxID=34254 RepID=A0AAV3QB56_LITER
MGKLAENEQRVVSRSSRDDAESTTLDNASGCCCCSCLKLNNLGGLFSWRCVFVLLLGAAVFVSAIFWLPFFHNGDGKDSDLYNEFAGHDIVASFMLEKPLPFLENYILHLEDDIFDEMSFSGTKVVILSLELEPSAGPNITKELEPSAGPNITKVLFAVDSDVKGARISSAVQSLVEQSFDSLVTRVTPLSLTPSLFGKPFAFDVLKFKGGMTVIPTSQSAYLIQRVQINFNFTLNFSINQILDNINELRMQLNSGLRLASYENLYITLTNLKGSTITPPTIVQARVVLAFGIDPSVSREKQLANRIKDPHTKNLGLNNTVFGRVKQVRLSSLHTSDGPSPAPTPLAHHHHHHHHSIHTPALSPSPQTEKGGSTSRKVLPLSAPMRAPVPAPAPASWRSHVAKPPGCHYKPRYPRKNNDHSHIPSAAPPVYAPYVAPSSQLNIQPPSSMVHRAPVSSPIPHVSLSHTPPPLKSKSPSESPDVTPSVSPSPSSFSASIRPSIMWSALLVLLLTKLHL